MRVTRAHTGNRRSHHALKEPRLSKCAKCGAQHLRHRMCPDCGNYRDRTVVDVVAKKDARMLKRAEKLKAMGEVSHDDDETVHEAPKDKKEEKLEAKSRTKTESVKVAKKPEAKKEK